MFQRFLQPNGNIVVFLHNETVEFSWMDDGDGGSFPVDLSNRIF